MQIGDYVHLKTSKLAAGYYGTIVDLYAFPIVIQERIVRMISKAVVRCEDDTNTDLTYFSMDVPTERIYVVEKAI